MTEEASENNFVISGGSCLITYATRQLLEDAIFENVMLAVAHSLGAEAMYKVRKVQVNDRGHHALEIPIDDVRIGDVDLHDIKVLVGTHADPYSNNLIFPHIAVVQPIEKREHARHPNIGRTVMASSKIALANEVMKYVGDNLAEYVRVFQELFDSIKKIDSRHIHRYSPDMFNCATCGNSVDSAANSCYRCSEPICRLCWRECVVCTNLFCDQHVTRYAVTSHRHGPCDYKMCERCKEHVVAGRAGFCVDCGVCITRTRRKCKICNGTICNSCSSPSSCYWCGNDFCSQCRSEHDIKTREVYRDERHRWRERVCTFCVPIGSERRCKNPHCYYEVLPLPGHHFNHYNIELDYCVSCVTRYGLERCMVAQWTDVPLMEVQYDRNSGYRHPF